jgi:hypothetical protein
LVSIGEKARPERLTGWWTGISIPLQLQQAELIPQNLLITHVQRRCEKHCPRKPSMNDVETFVAYSSYKPNKVNFSRKKNQEGKLSDCEPACPYTDGLIVLFARDFLLNELEGKDKR